MSDGEGVGCGAGVAERVGDGAGQAGPLTAASLTCGPFAAAGSVITRSPRCTRSPHPGSPGAYETALVYEVRPRRVRVSRRTVVAAPPSASRRVYAISSRTGPVPSTETEIEPVAPFQATMPAARTAGSDTEVPPCGVGGGGVAVPGGAVVGRAAGPEVRVVGAGSEERGSVWASVRVSVRA
ncbi:hypothetical protein ACFQ0B_73175 [Nonomuraea thailandensis]